MNWRALVAEAVGTFTLLTFGFLGVATVSILTNGAGDRLIAILIVPFAFGLGLMAAIGLGGHASGGHFNPAVTLGALIDRRVTPMAAVGYVVAQLIGGLVATLGILVITSQGVVRLAVNGPGPTTSGVMAQELNAFGVEIVMTAIFVAVILTVSRNYPKLAILVIPLTLVAIHFAAMHVSGASVNPVRSLAPALVSGTYAALWVYLAGPLIGGALGWGIYRLMLPPEDEVSVEIEDDYIDDLDDLLEDEADVADMAEEATGRIA